MLAAAVAPAAVVAAAAAVVAPAAAVVTAAAAVVASVVLELAERSTLPSPDTSLHVTVAVMSV